jgi:acetoin utilization protein AcuB
VDALPVILKDEFKGFVDLESLQKAKPNLSIEPFIKPNSGWVLTENFPYMEAIHRLADFEAKCLAIVNDQGHLMGTITKTSIINYLSQSYTLHAEGSVITIEMIARNYSLNELTRIIENEGTKILGVQLFSIPESSRIEVNIKLNTGFIERVTLSLQRFGFEVTNSYYTNQDDSDLELRYNTLIKYLEL